MRLLSPVFYIKFVMYYTTFCSKNQVKSERISVTPYFPFVRFRAGSLKSGLIRETDPLERSNLPVEMFIMPVSSLSGT